MPHLSGIALRAMESNITAILLQQNVAGIGYLIHGYVMQHFVLEPYSSPWSFFDSTLRVCTLGNGSACTFDVIHGLGHGLMMKRLLAPRNADSTKCIIGSHHAFNITSTSLNGALAECSSGPSLRHAYLCADGVFMSYFDAAHLAMGDSWFAPCGNTSYAAACFRYLFTRYVAHERQRITGTSLDTILLCHLSGSARTRRACIWGLSLWAFPALDASCTFPQDSVLVGCVAYPLVFDFSTVWKCNEHRSSLLRWCNAISSNEQDWLACISGSMVLVGQLQRYGLSQHAKSFCSQLELASFPRKIRQRAVQICVRTTMAFSNDDVLDYMYPVLIL